MDFTDEQERMIDSFQTDVQNLVVRHARNKRDAALIVDTPEFYGLLCDIIAEFAANHAIDVEYPEHVTTYEDGKTVDDIREIYDCTDWQGRQWWEEWVEKAKEKNDERS